MKIFWSIIKEIITEAWDWFIYAFTTSLWFKFYCTWAYEVSSSVYVFILFIWSSVTLSVTCLCEWMQYEWVSLIVIFELTSWLTHLKLQMSLEWMMMIPMSVDVDFCSCGLKLEVHWLRYSMHCSFMYSEWEFRHV